MSDASVRCARWQMEQKNCFLKNKNYRMQITSEKVLISDGVWREIVPLPLKGEKVVWESISLGFVAGRPILQFEIWDEPQGEGQIQTLHWYVMELKGPKPIVQLEKPLQKRAMISDESKRKPAVKDPKAFYGLKAGANGKIHWWLKPDSGSF